MKHKQTQSALDKKRILLIEDEEGVSRLVERTLVNNGYSVFPAFDAEEAMEITGFGVNESTERLTPLPRADHEVPFHAAILFAAGLSFLGLGDPNTMIPESKAFMVDVVKKEVSR
mgnify:CR=1 FL=1